VKTDAGIIAAGNKQNLNARKLEETIKTITITFLCSLFFSCDKWLDLDPAERVLEVNYYQTEEEAYKGLIAVYAMLKTQYFRDWSSWYMMYSMPSDDAVPHGGGRSDRPEFWSMHDFTVTPSTFGIADTWSRCYYGIYRANLLIENIESSSEVYDRIKAEATMLRAYFYFDLVRLWGEVPLVTKILPQSEYYQPKVAKKKIYDQIVEDLITASEGLPDNLLQEEKFRMSSWAAKALLGKVYVYMASPFYNYTDKDYYTLASEQLKDVIDNGPYELLEDYDQIWRYDNEFNNETIIEIAYGPSNDADGDEDTWGDGSANETNIIIQLNGPRAISSNDTILNGWGFDMVTLELVNEYRNLGDSIRLHGTVLAEWQLNDWGITVNEKNELYTGYYTKKRTTWAGANIGTHNHWAYGTNERVLRLADI
ncbi:MAG: RagB/SusD family nutrient uptake outer membrane protein, partial [Desulfobacterales bacterium]|nr:RagB/SusD family nutrient uptake outer membrane protein [Desulfobacterales bacterium]